MPQWNVLLLKWMCICSLTHVHTLHPTTSLHMHINPIHQIHSVILLDDLKSNDGHRSNITYLGYKFPFAFSWVWLLKSDRLSIRNFWYHLDWQYMQVNFGFMPCTFLSYWFLGLKQWSFHWIKIVAQSGPTLLYLLLVISTILVAFYCKLCTHSYKGSNWKRVTQTWAFSS